MSTGTYGVPTGPGTAMNSSPLPGIMLWVKTSGLLPETAPKVVSKLTMILQNLAGVVYCCQWLSDYSPNRKYLQENDRYLTITRQMLFARALAWYCSPNAIGHHEIVVGLSLYNVCSPPIFDCFGHFVESLRNFSFSTGV
jgi:hypothetical protein